VATAMLLASLLVVTVVSCGGGSGASGSTEDSAAKLPPGTTQESVATSTGNTIAETTDSTTDSTTATQTAATASSASQTVALDGVSFTVASAKRVDSNESVLSGSGREVAGDYLTVELAMQNVSDELVDLSDFSFRLYSAAITASDYDDYYGTTGTFGKYVSKHVITATLLDYSTLQSVAYTLRIGEALDDVFVFFDLNPQSTAANAGFNKADANLVIYNTSTGNSVEVNLGGFSD
jgi:hypothetical protein